LPKKFHLHTAHHFIPHIFRIIYPIKWSEYNFYALPTYSYV
jgi:hypothetical protein